MLERAKNRPVYEVEAADVTVAGMIRYLRDQFCGRAENQPVFILRIFEKQRTRRAMIALFLAVLEMVRMQAVVVTQKDLFGEIALRRHGISTRFSRAISPSRRLKTSTSDGNGRTGNTRMEELAQPEDTPNRSRRGNRARRRRPFRWRMDGSSEPAGGRRRSPVSLEDVQLAGGAGGMRVRGRGAADAGADRRRARIRIRSASARCCNWLMAEFDKPEHGVSIKEVAGGYKMATKAEHHEAVRNVSSRASKRRSSSRCRRWKRWR
jgi:hypothetical protein